MTGHAALMRPSQSQPPAVQARAVPSPANQKLTQLAAGLNARPNRTGLPDGLKAGVESLSGLSLDAVKVHYNSPQPAQLNAHAYAQGTDIHLAPGQERHLPHEAWHVVQQAQGRVRPTAQLRSSIPLNNDHGLEQEADMMGARAGALQRRARGGLRAGLCASTSQTPIQLVGENSWWSTAGAIAGGAMGLGYGLYSGDYSMLGTVLATVAGTMLGRQAGIELPSLGYLSGNKTKDKGPLKGLTDFQTRPTPPGTIEGFVPGESRHKKIIKQVFNNLNPEESGKGFLEKQTALEQDTQGTELDAKTSSDIYTASIMRDPAMMGTAVKFLGDMSTLYGTGGDRAHVLAGHKAEMQHLWPNQDTKGDKNTKYRGYQSVAKSLVTASKKGNPLSAGLQANKDTLAKLQQKHAENQPFTLEETNYVLRAMGQLRDVMKTEKGMVPDGKGAKEAGLVKAALETSGNWQDGTAKKNRINDKGKGSAGLGRNKPGQHGWSRSNLRWAQPLGTQIMQGNDIYKYQSGDNKTKGSFDYLQGTSGTTLDMLNFFLAQGKSRDEAAQLMQVFYANWHAVAPDGNAHSQIESTGTMMQYLYGKNLQSPIMAPIKSADDADAAVKGGFASDLGVQDSGFLSYAPPKTGKSGKPVPPLLEQSKEIVSRDEDSKQELVLDRNEPVLETHD